MIMCKNGYKGSVKHLRRLWPAERMKHAYVPFRKISPIFNIFSPKTTSTAHRA